MRATDADDTIIHDCTRSGEADPLYLIAPCSARPIAYRLTCLIRIINEWSHNIRTFSRLKQTIRICRVYNCHFLQNRSSRAML